MKIERKVMQVPTTEDGGFNYDEVSSNAIVDYDSTLEQTVIKFDNISLTQEEVESILEDMKYVTSRCG